MRLLSTVVFSALASLASSAAVSIEELQVYDAIIVGGGPSGLAALSGLARVRRNVLLIDSGVYRNAPTRHMHDVLGFDGVTPAYYRWAAREQISYYKTVTMKNGTVTKITPTGNKTEFTVMADMSEAGAKTYKARKIVLATGLHDILPNTPGLKENWGKGIYWCPWCDGHEHADQPLGLLAPLGKIPGLVREILTLNNDIIAFVNGTDTAEARTATDKAEVDWETYLRIHNVKVENRTMTEIRRTKNGTDGHEDPSLPTVAEHDEFFVEFDQGEPVQRAAFLASFADEQASKVGEQMGVKLIDGRLTANQSAGLITNIYGVYAVGDANSDRSTNVPHALYTGKRAAVSLHITLEKENAKAELRQAGKRAVQLDARSVWETMNGKRGDLLYAENLDA